MSVSYDREGKMGLLSSSKGGDLHYEEGRRALTSKQISRAIGPYIKMTKGP